MKIDRNVELLRALEDRPELREVDEFAIGQAVQHGSLESAIDTALELVGGSLGQRRRQGGEGGEPRGIAVDGLRQPIVDAGSKWRRDIRRQLLRRRGAVRQHTDIDACRVHVGETVTAEAAQATFDRSRP